MIRILFAVAVCAAMLGAQTPATQEQWRGLSFLEGTWTAKTRAGSAGADASGDYTFRKELGGHVLARHSMAAGCKGPVDFNCEHSDLLYIYPGEPVRAIYFDNEGHVIHYTVSTPTAGSAVFLSDATAPGPQFRLMYELKGGAMEGKFQMRMPGKTEWTSYLEWTGARK